MRDKLDVLIEEKYELKKPIIMCSIQEIETVLQAGEVYEGSFKLYNASEGILNGQLYSPLKELKLDTVDFEEDVEVKYTIDSTTLANMGKKESYIQVISNGGELRIPLTVTVQPPAFETSIGSIKDLYQLTDLAKSHWEEATIIFLDDKFKEIFLKQQPDFIQIYNLLIKSSSVDNALDEFLVLNNKKKPLQLSLPKKVKKLTVTSKPVEEVLEIKSESWGCVMGTIITESPFIKIPKSNFNQEAFQENVARFKYRILPEYMHYGPNDGVIRIETDTQTLTYEIQVTKQKPIEVYLDQLSYSVNEVGHLIIHNPLKQSLSIEVQPKDKWISVEKEYFQSNQSMEIALTFKQPVLGNFLKSNLISKQLIVTSGLKIKVRSEDYYVSKELPIKIALQMITHATI